MSYSRLDSPTIDDNGRSVMARCSHKATRHILVTAWNRNVSVVMLGLQTTSDPEKG